MTTAEMSVRREYEQIRRGLDANITPHVDTVHDGTLVRGCVVCDRYFDEIEREYFDVYLPKAAAARVSAEEARAAVLTEVTRQWRASKR